MDPRRRAGVPDLPLLPVAWTGTCGSTVRKPERPSVISVGTWTVEKDAVKGGSGHEALMSWKAYSLGMGWLMNRGETYK